ncbi:putative serine/threonine-protein phosphatase with EF-hands [Plasmopara halstedii]
MEEMTSVSQDAREHDAAACLQRMVRCRQARKRLHHLVTFVFEKYYDADSGQEYYLDKRTGETTWEKPRSLYNGQDIEVTAIYQSHDEVSSTLLEEVKDTSEQDIIEGTQGDDARGFTTQELAIAREQFAHYDTDSSASLSASELHQLLTHLGEELTIANVRDLMKAVGTDQSGEVTFDAFLHMLRTQHDKNPYSVSLELALLFGPKELAQLKQQFQILDSDGSGSIDEMELQQIIKKFGRQSIDFDVSAMLREVDKDKSGKIEFNEFLYIVASMTRSDASDSKSSFAALLDLGITQGILKGLDDVVHASRQKFYDWLNADQIAEQKRRDDQRERQKRRELSKQQQLATDRAIYAKHQAEVAAIERARLAPVEGLKILVDFQGDGCNFPLVGQFARVHYVATFLDTGKVFESTRKRCGSALELCVGVGHLILGFDLALQRMSVGETAQVTIGPALAYGVKGQPPCIPPNAALVFRIELISIKEKLVTTNVTPLTPVQRIRKI